MLHAVHLLLSTVNARRADSTGIVPGHAAHGAYGPCYQKMKSLQTAHYLGSGGGVVSEEYWNTSVRG